MKTLKQIRKIVKPIEFFAHFKSESDPKHRIENEEIPTFFAHFKSATNQKHRIKDELDEAKKINSNNSLGSEKPEKKSEVMVVKIKEPLTTSFEQSTKNTEHHQQIETPDKHIHAIQEYINGSKEINDPLHKRRSLNKKYTKTVAHLDEVTRHKENALPGPVTTYSGVSTEHGKKLSKVKLGARVTSPSFISSSTSKKIAQTFGNNGKDENHHIVFHLPKGYSKARHIQHFSLLKEEEVLHARNQSYKKIGEHKEPLFVSGKIVGTRVYHHLAPD